MTAIGAGRGVNRRIGSRVHDAIDLVGKSQGSFAVSSAGGAQSGALNEGIYDVWSDVNVYIKVVEVDGTASNVTASTGYLLRAGNTVPLFVRHGGKIGGRTGSGSGTLRYHQVV